MRLNICVLLTAAICSATAVADDRQDAFRRVVLSRIDDQHLAGIVRDTRTLFYDREDVPPAFQITGKTQAGNVKGGGASQRGFFSTKFNPAVDGDWQFQTGNFSKDFPWESPAGMHIVPEQNFRTFRFVRLSADQDGETLPVAWFHSRTIDRDNVDDATQLVYTYPAGTVFGEVLLQKIGEGRFDPFEIRTRTKQSSQEWDVAVYRRWGSSDELAKSIEEMLPRGDWSNEPGIRKVLGHLRQPKALPVINISDSSIHPDRQVIHATGGLDVLPAFDDDRFVRSLLASNRLQEVTGGTWETGTNGAVSYAPAVATSNSLHVVPQNYAAFPFEMSNESCMRCHATAGQGVKHFDKSVGRWYGHVGGSDGVFSFHPFDKKSIGDNVFPAVLRTTKAVPVEQFSDKLNSETYAETKGDQIAARYEDSMYFVRTSVCRILDRDKQPIGSGVLIATVNDANGRRGAVITTSDIITDRGPYFAAFPNGRKQINKLSVIGKSLDLNVALLQVEDVSGLKPAPLTASKQDGPFWFAIASRSNLGWSKAELSSKSDAEFTIDKTEEHPQPGTPVITARGVVVGISVADQKCRHGSAIWEWLASNEDVPRWVRGDVKTADITRFKSILRRDLP